MAESSLSRSIGFHDLPAELRDIIYHLVFDQAIPFIPHDARYIELPINQDQIQFTSDHDYCIRLVCNLFLASRRISREARDIFYAQYFARRHYNIRYRDAIYHFSRLPSQWTQTLHQIDLTAYSIMQGRKILNPIRVALVNAARADNHRDLSTCFRADYLELEPWQIGNVKCKFTATLKLGGLLTTLDVCLAEQETFQVRFVGPVGRLDWRMIALTRYTEDAAWEQTKARRARLLQGCTLAAPLHQIPASLSSPSPYLEDSNAAVDVVIAFGEEVARAAGFEVPKTRMWYLSDGSLLV